VDRTAERGACRFLLSARSILLRYPLGETPAQRLKAMEKAASDLIPDLDGEHYFKYSAAASPM
jgi:hypothetical protein